ncbi:MAG: GerMN domain-containing protein [Acidobacteriota bacterium]
MSVKIWLAAVLAGLFILAVILVHQIPSGSSLSTALAATAAKTPPEVSGKAATASVPDDRNAAPVAGGLRTMAVVLYFARPDGQGLAPQTRTIFQTAALLGQMKQTVVALIDGPGEGSLLLPVLPGGVSLLDIYVDGDGTAYLDFGRDLIRRLQPGLSGEILATGALISTLTANFPMIRRLKILVMGEEIRTLGGHLDLDDPLLPDPSLIRPLEPEPEEGEDGLDPENQEPAPDPTWSGRGGEDAAS